MKYVLSVLTHGDNEELLKGLVQSFAANVTPTPSAYVVVQDGPCTMPPMLTSSWQGTQLSPQGGFCLATEELWSQSIRVADDVGADYVFWLEHDFEFIRPVALQDLADALDSHPSLAQMSLMRGAVNDEERAAGGVVGKHAKAGSPFIVERDESGNEWLSHSAYFTTNPSLMTIRFMAANPWLDATTECEGKFGILLIERGYRFGAFGGGEPWVEHVGVRSGFGY